MRAVLAFALGVAVGWLVCRLAGGDDWLLEGTLSQLISGTVSEPKAEPNRTWNTGKANPLFGGAWTSADGVSVTWTTYGKV